MLFFSLSIPEQLLHFLRVHMAMNVVSDDHIGGQGTNADASDGLQGVFQIRAGLSLFYTQVLFDKFQYCLPSPNVAGCPWTDSDQLSPAGLRIELRVESNHRFYLAGEKPQGSGYERYGLRRDIAELSLNLLEQRYQGPLLVTMFGDDGTYL